MHSLALIIDDDPISILVTETILKKASFAAQIRTFEAAPEALTYLSTEPLPDHYLLFLDIKMPVMDGWQFLEEYTSLPQVAALPPHVIMLSAAADPEDKSRADAHPLVLHFLYKPVRLDSLAAITTGFPPQREHP